MNVIIIIIMKMKIMKWRNNEKKMKWNIIIMIMKWQ